MSPSLKGQKGNVEGPSPKHSRGLCSFVSKQTCLLRMRTCLEGRWNSSKGAWRFCWGLSSHTSVFSWSSQHVDIAALLIKYNTCVNATDKWAFTPLHEAAQKGRTQLCALLLAHGADPTMKNQEGQTPLDLATVSPCCRGGYDSLWLQGWRFLLY